VQETEAAVASETAEIIRSSTAPDSLPAVDTAQPAPEGLEGDQQKPESADQPADASTEILQALRELADSSERYHVRAEHREGVIDHLHSEVDRLRRGERRALLRPLLVEMCRLRNDLLRQADDLPPDFDAERARVLLRSYADSMELALEDNGVVTYAPEEGTTFEPRMQRRVGGEPTSDPAVAGRVARVRRHGYLDVEANTPITPAEVVLFRAVSAAPTAAATEERNEP
jgi:molecular chaperone GrpE